MKFSRCIDLGADDRKQRKNLTDKLPNRRTLQLLKWRWRYKKKTLTNRISRRKEKVSEINRDQNFNCPSSETIQDKRQADKSKLAMQMLHHCSSVGCSAGQLLLLPLPKCRNADALNQSITLRLAIVVVEVLSIRTIQGREKVNARDNVTAEAQVAEGSVHIGIN